MRGSRQLYNYNNNNKNRLFSVVLCSLSFSLASGFVPLFASRLRRQPCSARHLLEDDTGRSIVMKEMMEEGIGVGIDLGTTFSAVAVLVDGNPTIVSVPHNGRTMPSVINLENHADDDDDDDDDGTTTVWVGREAIAREVDHPLGTYRNIKRVIGVGATNVQDIASVVPNLIVRQQDDDDYDDPSALFSGNKKRKRGRNNNKRKKKKKKKKPRRETLVQKIENARTNPALIYGVPDNDGRRNVLRPEELSSHIVRKLVETAQDFTGQKVNRAVIGVPAYFNDAQREATTRAAELAGVARVKLLREPEAAALAYGVGKDQIGQGEMEELVLVFDLGGGTYDVSILLVGDGLTEVLSTSGDAKLGGSDFDLRIAEHLAKELVKNGGPEQRNILKEGTEAADSMVRAAEAVRIHLSNNRNAVLALPRTSQGWATLAHPHDIILGNDWNDELLSGQNTTHFHYQLARSTMEGICRDLFESLLRPIREVAIVSGALLPGDSRPSVVEAALAMEAEFEEAMSASGMGQPLVFDDFYAAEEEKELAAQTAIADPQDVADIDPDILLQLQQVDMKERKKAQQRGRRKARNVAKQEKKFRAEKRRVNAASSSNARVIDGIGGRPIARVVLVGGATRMPAIGRLLAAVTGVVPQRTVNPDEAVALGCAVKVGVLDGDDDLGLTVLNPMQAAIMRAIAEQQQQEGLLLNQEDGDDDMSDFDYDGEFEMMDLSTAVGGDKEEEAKSNDDGCMSDFNFDGQFNMMDLKPVGRDDDDMSDFAYDGEFEMIDLGAVVGDDDDDDDMSDFDYDGEFEMIDLSP